MKDTLKKYETIAVIDTIEDRLLSQSLELVSYIKYLCINNESEALLVVTGRSIMEECRILAENYGLDVAVVEHDDFYFPNPFLLSRVLSDIINECSPGTLCFSHTIRNCSIAASLSATLNIPCVTTVESVTDAAEGTVYHRSIFNGKLKERVKVLSTQKIITIMPGVFQSKTDEGVKRDSNLYLIKPDTGKAEYIPLSIKADGDSESVLENADVIISAGRGIGKPESLELVKEVARLFDNAALGASRPVCDNKWLPYRHQVGVTGKTVSPKLYMALGISGSQQHIAGMKNSQCIVAVNTDSNAAIFSVADYIIVEDIKKFIPVLLKRYNERSD